MTQVTTRHREFSVVTLLLGAVFILTLSAAFFVDLDGLLEYFGLISGSSAETLELGSIVSAGTVVPFLAMGMSISADMYRNEKVEVQQMTAGEH